MRLLLDAHLPRALTVQLRRHRLDVKELQVWRNGSFLKAADDAILGAAYEDRRVLVTRDKRTIPPLLRQWGETGRHHAGLILVPEKSFRPRDIGGLMRAVLKVVEASEEDWEDKIIYLRP